MMPKDQINYLLIIIAESFLKFLIHYDFISMVILPSLLIAAVTDIRSGMIRNWLTFRMMTFAIVFHMIRNILYLYLNRNGESLNPIFREIDDYSGLLSIQDTITGGIVCFMLMLLNFLVVGGGGGDVKLASAIGFGYGLTAGINILITTFLIAAFFSIIILAIRPLVNAIYRYFPRLVAIGISLTEDSEPCTGENQNQIKIRMGPYFAIATWLYVYGAI